MTTVSQQQLHPRKLEALAKYSVVETRLQYTKKSARYYTQCFSLPASFRYLHILHNQPTGLPQIDISAKASRPKHYII